MPKNRHFFVYIMTNGPRSHVLYTGITGSLPHRVFQHKNKRVAGFTSRYNLTRLVYYIESMNPHWHDLVEKWQDIYKPEPVC